MSKLTYSIFELFSDNFLDAQENWQFIIPDYQRGYKWGEKPVTKLLNDIERFDFRGEEEKFYCLNNLTIVRRSETKTSVEYNVVDGQQRLTTTTVILACLKHLDASLALPSFENKISYKIRETTQDFLSKLVNNDNFSINGKDIHFQDFFSDESSVSWEDFINSYEEYDYQDIYYLFNAYKTTFEWLKRHENSHKEFAEKLLNHVKLIVNNVSDVENEATLFGNLNSNKVQLDGADLVRALIITNVARIEAGEVEDSLKRKILINERRTRIGLQIDSIMHWWKDASHQDFFQILIKTVKTDTTNNIKFDEKKNPLNYLYQIYSLLYHDNNIALECFEEDVALQWRNILQLQRILEQWYDDNKIYHALGFVLRYCQDRQDLKVEDQSINPETLFLKWRKLSIGQFYKYLLEIISKFFDDKFKQSNELSPEEYEKTCFEENWYEDDKTIPVMILLDIIHEENKNKRLPVDLFVNKDADKEHIFPQTPLGAVTNKKEIVERKKILEEYINLVNDCVDERDKVNIPEPIESWNEERMLSPELENLQTEINEKIKKIIPLNCLGNICLLEKGLNRSYGNDFYTAKRLAVVHNYFNGNYIRPHVVEAFDKSLEERKTEKTSMDIMDSWKKDDIINRRKHIVASINSYLAGTWKE